MKIFLYVLSLVLIFVADVKAITLVPLHLSEEWKDTSIYMSTSCEALGARLRSGPKCFRFTKSTNLRQISWHSSVKPNVHFVTVGLWYSLGTTNTLIAEKSFVHSSTGEATMVSGDGWPAGLGSFAIAPGGSVWLRAQGSVTDPTHGAPVEIQAIIWVDEPAEAMSVEPQAAMPAIFRSSLF